MRERTTMAMRVFWDDSARRKAACNLGWSGSLDAPEVGRALRGGPPDRARARRPVPRATRGRLGRGGDRLRARTGVRGARRSLRPGRRRGHLLGDGAARVRARRPSTDLVPGRRRAALAELRRRVGRPRGLLRRVPARPHGRGRPQLPRGGRPGAAARWAARVPMGQPTRRAELGRPPSSPLPRHPDPAGAPPGDARRQRHGPGRHP